MALKKSTEEVAPEMDDITDEQDNPNLPARVEASGALGVCEGEFAPGDLRLPRLQIVYGVGKLSAEFNPGSLVLGRDTLLVEKGKPLEVIILGTLKYWKEYTSGKTYDPNKIPRSYKTAAEVTANGGTTDWVGSQGPTFSRAMQLKMLIQQPEGVLSSIFDGITIGGKNYAPAVWDVDKQAYKRVGSPVNVAANFSLKNSGLLAGRFEITTKSEVVNKNNTIVPTIKLLPARNTDEEIEQIKALFGAPAPVDPDAF